jgi:tetratricopeptide (TPR) repeat protein
MRGPTLEARSRHAHLAPRNRMPFLLGILLAGAIVRLVLFAQARGTPLWDLVFLDALSYHNWAQRLAAGDWIGREAFHMPPLYPYLLGVVYRILGAGDAIKVLQAGLGVLNGALIFLIAYRIGGRTIGVLAFLLSLLYGPFLFYEIQLLNTTFAITLALLLILALDSAAHARDARAGGGRALVAGLLLGAGALVRPEFLLFAPLAASALFVLTGRRPEAAAAEAAATPVRTPPRPSERRPSSGARLVLLFAAGAAVPLGISGARNALVSGDFVLITHHGGISFYMGNNETTDGTYRPPPYFQGTPEAIDQRDSKRFAEMDAGRPLKMSEVEGYWYRKAFRFMRERPGAYLALLARKFALYWGDYEIPLNASWDFFKRYSPILSGAALSFGIIVPLAAVGGFAVARDPRARRHAIFPALFVLANMAAVVAFFVTDRYRLPAAPLLIVFAAAGIAWLVAQARAAVGRRGMSADATPAAGAHAWRPLVAAVGIVIVLAALLHVRLAGNPSLSFARSHVAVGQSALRRGDRAAAEAAFRDAIRENPFYLDAYMNLGTLYQERGELDRAVAAYDDLLARNPDFAGAYLNRGACRQAQGRLDAALADYRRAEELDPYSPAAPNNAGFALAQLGRSEEAEAAYQRAIEKDPAFVDARANLARLFEATGRPDAAMAQYEALLGTGGATGAGGATAAEGAPEGGAAGGAPAALASPAMIAMIEARLGDLLVARSRFAEAEPHYRRALANAPPTPELLIRLGIALSNLRRANEALAMLLRAVNEFPQSAETAWQVGNVLSEWGDLASAARVYEDAAARFPSDTRFPYGAAVAHARAGNIPPARRALDEAVRRGGEPIREAAARDPRLAALAGR